jgi:hypothetical protein
VSGFYRHIAFFLLVVFARVLVPDALVLELHAHAHTEHNCVVEDNGHHPKLEQGHTHCPVENVFHSPFQLVLAVQDGLDPVYPDAYSDVFTPSRDFSFFSTITLRGPPLG